MAKAVEDHWDGPLEGLVITRYGHGLPTRQIEVVEAAHPVPDETGLAATEAILSWLRGLSPDDLVLFLGSGGASSLLVRPAPGITLADKQRITRALLKSGADIHAINAVRKHLSAVKGGRLALLAQPASVVGLYISDVGGDDPSAIASGPTVADPTTRAAARATLAQRKIPVPAAVTKWLASPRSESPKPGDARFVRVRNDIIATSEMGLTAAAEKSIPLPTVSMDYANPGEARDFAGEHARQLTALDTAAVYLSGGETTVTVRGTGRGGRNTEFLLALALALDGRPNVWAIACDTDGIDGTEDNAGAILAPDTLTRAKSLGLDARAMLENNDSYGFFAALNDLVRVGPTRTNVSDFRAILAMP
jgi:hydroxypyruvate reductase